MFKKLASIVIITAIVGTLGGTSAFANSSSNPDVKTDSANVPSAPAKKEENSNEQLKDNMLKLVADAKAGKVAPVAKSQLQPAKSNNWSKRTKIAIGVGVAVAVVVVVLVVNHARNHFFDDFHPFRQVGN
jgi:Flp pilus assembly protein TadB